MLLRLIVVAALMLAGCSPQSDSVRLRVMTYNIHVGVGTDGKRDLPRIAAIITRCSPDLVALQELDVGTARTGQIDEPAELSRLTGMQVYFAKTLNYMGGQYGIAILSRHPIEQPTFHPLPCTPFREPRTVLAARIAVQGHRLRFLCTHLDATGDEQDSLPGAAQINDLFGHSDENTILAGDMNKAPASPTIHALLACWNNATHSSPRLTSPALRPRHQIDYVFYRPAGNWRVVNSTVLEEPIASDHRPLLVDFEFFGNTN